MNFLHSVVLGIVEGFTEFLPISSTGHLILTSTLLRLPATEFWKSFEIAIQLGSILAVVVLYVKRYIKDVPVIKRIVVAFLPTAALGLIFYKLIKQFLLGNSLVVLWSLLLGGAALIIFELLYKEKPTVTEDLSAISYKQCLLIGLCQSVAMVPGVSRSGSTIVGSMLLGVEKRAAAEFSFLVGLPILYGACGIKLLHEWQAIRGPLFWPMVVGIVVAFLSALVVVRPFVAFLRTHSFAPFAIYRLIAGTLLGLACACSWL